MTETQDATDAVINLSVALTKRPKFTPFSAWLVGDTPLITHAWSEKARREMLGKQVKAVKAGKEARNPEEDFVNSLYDMGNGRYGFPATGVKNCILSAAHKDKGIARVLVQSTLWINAELTRVRPALAGAVCDVPLLRIFGSPPEMREDMVKIGSGAQKTANLAYRAQFTVWAFRVTGKFNTTAFDENALAFLIAEAGVSYGVGEWRNERKGMFGAFHIADADESVAWTEFADKDGPLPIPASYQAAAE